VTLTKEEIESVPAFKAFAMERENRRLAFNRLIDIENRIKTLENATGHKNKEQ